MSQRLALALLLACGLAACKQDDTPAGQQRVAGLGSVRVLDARVTHYSNDSHGDFTPQIDHFSYLDRDGNRFQAQDSGSTVFAGVSNSQMVLKQGEKRTYTMGFRTTDPSTSGTISYDF